jgi:hypothetical protein
VAIVWACNLIHRSTHRSWSTFATISTCAADERATDCGEEKAAKDCSPAAVVEVSARWGAEPSGREWVTTAHCKLWIVRNRPHQ